MNDKLIQKEAERLVSITIEHHKKKLLGKIKMTNFLKKYEDKKIAKICGRSVLRYYCKFLAQAGYEIKMDTDHFEIINYRSREYEIYIEEIMSQRPENYEELRKESKYIALKMINIYEGQKVKNKSYKEIYNLALSANNYNDEELAVINVGITHYITDEYYDIKCTEPLKLAKF